MSLDANGCVPFLLLCSLSVAIVPAACSQAEQRSPRVPMEAPQLALSPQQDAAASSTDFLSAIDEPSESSGSTTIAHDARVDGDGGEVGEPAEEEANEVGKVHRTPFALLGRPNGAAVVWAGDYGENDRTPIHWKALSSEVKKWVEAGGFARRAAGSTKSRAPA